LFVAQGRNSIIAVLRAGSYGKIGAAVGKLPVKKRKAKRFRAVQAVKAIARERIGAPPASQVVPSRKKKKTEKHKVTLRRMLEES
jgi:hypothetical protein